MNDNGNASSTHEGDQMNSTTFPDPDPFDPDEDPFVHIDRAAGRDVPTVDAEIIDAEIIDDGGGEAMADVVELAARFEYGDPADDWDDPTAGPDRDPTDVDDGGPVELLDPQGRPVPVDPPGSGRVRLGDRIGRGHRRPVVPLWMRSVAGVTSAARWVGGHYAHVSAYHAFRLPVYAARLAVRAPVGCLRVAGGGVRWLFDAEGVPVRAAVVARADAEMYLKLIRHRDARVRARTLLSTFAALLGTILLSVFLAGWLSAPEPVWWAVLAGTVLALGVIGSPADRPIASPAVLAPEVAKLTANIVIRALGSLGIGAINQTLAKDPKGIAFVAPITRDGPGWRADLDLPYGVTVGDVLERREKLASGLRRAVGCVWPEPAAEAHAGRLVLWVGDQDMAKLSVPWPLARRGAVDLFEPIPVGNDPRGRVVRVSLMENNVLIGSLPGGGKTATARVYLLAAGLDPTSEVWAFNLKANNDIASAAKFAHRYAAGIGDDTIELVLQSLRDLKAEIMRRAEAMKGLPVDVCPDGKVTRPLANRRTLGLHPLVMFVDECQNLFAHPDFGKEAGELAEWCIKLGRALGVVLLLATQRPDKNSLPTGVSANVSIRFCLRVMGQTENDMILGTSMYQNGIRATTFRASDKGIGYLIGASDDPQIVRSAYIDLPDAEKVADRARAARIAAGRLAGYAVDQTNPGAGPDGRVTSTLLDDVAAVLPAGEAKVWSETIVERLADLRPDTYGGWTPEQLSSALKPYGITTTQVGRRIDGADGKVVNRRGIVADHIRSAITQRNTERDRKRDAS